MRIFLLIIGLICFKALNAQEIGIINDPDGYTNIRKGPGTKYKILDQLDEGKKFKYYSSNKSNWWKVKTIPRIKGIDTINGYVHNSRIQPYRINYNTDCKCKYPFSTDNNANKPIFFGQISNNSITVCGYLLQRYSSKSIKISEFSVTNCNKKELIKFYSARHTCKLSFSENRLEVVEFDRLPIGKNFKWVEIPYKQTNLISENGELIFTPEKIILDLSKVSNRALKKFENELESYDGKGYFDGIDTFIGKLLICSMKGSEKCKKVFNNVESYLDFTLDGAYKLFYKDTRKIYKEFNR